MTCRIENGVTYTHTFRQAQCGAYNAENRASSIAKRNGDCATGTILESWSFAYDGDGTRVMTAHFTGTQGTPDSVTSYFMGGAYELKDGATKKYYSIAGMMVATQDASGLQYLLTDHLGSTVAVTNSSGTLTSQQRYLPFGAARSIPNSPIVGTDFTYTGQRLLDSGMGGIMDYKARFYSPYITQFSQPDTIVSNPYNPQAWNRYAYVLNNPIRYNDPTGHVCTDPEDETPTCFGSGTTRVGDRMIRGNGAELGAAKNLNKKDGDDEEWEYRLDVDLDLHIGPISGAHVPDYHGGSDRDDLVPYIPGVSTGQPNYCAGGGIAGIACLVSVFTSFGLVYGPTDQEPNFFLSFTLHYREATNSLAMSTVQMSNRYQGNALFASMTVNNKVIHQGADSYMPRGGYYPLDNSSGVYYGSDRLEINIVIFTMQQLSNGPSAIPHTTNVLLPSLPEMKCMCNLP
jgi:RHS repeat-associated protein